MLSTDFQTERLNFRRPSADDLPFYTTYCISERTKYVGGPFTEVQAFDKLASMIGHWEIRGFGRYVIVERSSGRPTGHVGALQLDSSDLPEITWTLWSSDDEGKGLANEASAAFLTHAPKVFGFKSLVAYVHFENAPSRRLAEKLGGVLGVGALSPAWLKNSVRYEFSLEG